MSNVFRLSKEAVQTLDIIVRDTDSASRSEVLKKALRLIELVNEVDKDGGRLFVRNRDGEESEVILW